MMSSFHSKVPLGNNNKNSNRTVKVFMLFISVIGVLITLGGR